MTTTIRRGIHYDKVYMMGEKPPVPPEPKKWGFTDEQKERMYKVSVSDEEWKKLTEADHEVIARKIDGLMWKLADETPEVFNYKQVMFLMKQRKLTLRAEAREKNNEEF